MREDTLCEGDDVELTFIRESKITGTERRTVDVEVRAVTGNIVTFENPYGQDGPLMVVDPEGDVWARDNGQDGYYGRNAEISA